MSRKRKGQIATPPQKEGFFVDPLEEELAALFAEAIKTDRTEEARQAKGALTLDDEGVFLTIDKAVNALKEAAETPEDRVIRLCEDLIEACRATPAPGSLR